MKAKIIKKQKSKSREFIGPNGDDSWLWGDIESETDEEWAEDIRRIFNLGPETRKKTPPKKKIGKLKKNDKKQV